MKIFFEFLMLFLLSAGLTAVFRFFAIKHQLLAIPNHRSSHTIPTPHGAGVVFVVLWSVYGLSLLLLDHLSLPRFLGLLVGAFFVALIGFMDDHFDIAARWRFLVYLLVAIAEVILIGGWGWLDIGFYQFHWGVLGSIIAMMAMVWSINLYNFMDGTDGLAAVEAVFVFGVGGYLFWHAGAIEVASLIWGLLATILGFLFWNFPPAKVFMGDAGSAFLGFLVAIFAMVGEKFYHIPSLLWVILYSMFIVDATLTLVRRIIIGEKWYLAHKHHAFQRLQLKNMTHFHILLGSIVVNTILAILALLAVVFPSYLLLFVVAALAMTSTIYVMIEKQQPMFG